ncbi:hypothetical protein J2W14_004168 [Pseudarthrobacter oxydans]|uniref:hypothetical protein n=1 Tax=Pseudarthrobacter oxydans TaxID=1671 RepID=UPI002785DE18|nr:hypothetical protein [Pseudarthrobacter oxydans]MDP9984741.1 hypothetical protein [Pseudarthrobacter oxydans]
MTCAASVDWLTFNDAITETGTDWYRPALWAAILGPIGAILAIPLTLLVRLMLVDRYPPASLVRPLLSYLSETKKLIADEHAQTRA